MSRSAQRLQNLSYMTQRWQSRRLYRVTKYVSCVGQLSLRGPGGHVIKVCMFLKLTVSTVKWWISFLKEKKSNSIVLPVWVLKVFTIFGCLFVKKSKIKFESCFTENICQIGKSFLKPSSESVSRIQIAAYDSRNDFKSCPYPENFSESKLWYTVPKERGGRSANSTYVQVFKGTVSWDRFQKFWQKFTEPGLTKVRSWFLNFLGAPMIL